MVARTCEILFRIHPRKRSVARGVRSFRLYFYPVFSGVKIRIFLIPLEKSIQIFPSMGNNGKWPMYSPREPLENPYRSPGMSPPVRCVFHRCIFIIEVCLMSLFASKNYGKNIGSGELCVFFRMLWFSALGKILQKYLAMSEKVCTFAVAFERKRVVWPRG